MSEVDIVLGRHLPFTHNGKSYAGKIVQIEGEAYKIKYFAKGHKSTKRIKYVWQGKGALGVQAKEHAKSKGPLIALLGVVSTLLFFNPQAKLVVEAVKAVLEHL